MSLPTDAAPDGWESAFRVAPRPGGTRELRRYAARVATVSALWQDGNRWTWISVPASLLPADVGR
ncbi:hypothetical protein [Roseomonas sp. BN140053]|uniref:hypothetical protein n=1 Tax=Roseomonas sp. BN140053 TaxID=3391898 RepID=UPI0039E72C47